MIKPHRQKSYFLHLCVLTVNIGALSAGTCIAWSSPAIPKLNGREDQDKNPLQLPITSYEASILGSLVAIGSIFSPLLAILSDKIGRRKALLLASTLMLLSYLTLYLADNLWIFYLGRFLCGLSVGWYIVIIPIYVSELSEKHNRGSLNCFFKVNITAGNLLVFAIGPYMDLKYFSLLCLLPPAFLFCLVLIYIPESPFYLVTKGLEVEALDALKTLRRREDVYEEFKEISENVTESFMAKLSVFDLFQKKSLRKCLFLTTGLLSFQQLSGITAVLYFMQTIFEMTGSSLTPEQSSLLVGAIQFLSSLITPFLTDRHGRRLFFYLSGIGSTISLTTLATYLHLQSENVPMPNLNFLPIICLFVYVISYTIGYGPVPYIILGEIYPPHIKQAATTVSVSVCFVCASLTALLFPYMNDAIGISGTFWVFGGFCLLSIVFAYCFLPETKMKSFTEIQKMMGILPEDVNVKKKLESVKY